MMCIFFPLSLPPSSPSTSFPLTILSIARHLSQFLSQSPNHSCRHSRPYRPPGHLSEFLSFLSRLVTVCLSASHPPSPGIYLCSSPPFCPLPSPPRGFFQEVLGSLPTPKPCQHPASSQLQVTRKFKAKDTGLLLLWLVLVSTEDGSFFLSSLTFDLTLPLPLFISFSSAFFSPFLFVLSHDPAPSFCFLPSVFLSHYFFLILPIPSSPSPLLQPSLLLHLEESQTLSL